MSNVKMKKILRNAAGIDVGSRSHFVAIGQNATDVKEFGVYSQDHQKMIAWLHQMGITHVAMESTGSYWQTLFSALQYGGFEVMLVNGNQTKNARGKTDVKDCQWIQKLHSIGLLTGSFLPSTAVQEMKDIYRHRSSLIEDASRYTNRMQKALRAMNFRLDIAVSDINGKSGTKIIEAVLNGQIDPDQLASMADPRVKKSKEELAAALTGNWNKQQMEILRDCYDLYKTMQEKIAYCDQRIEQLLKLATEDRINDQRLKIKKRKPGKNQPDIDLEELSINYYGVNLMAIPSVSYSTVLALISEVGKDIFKFKTAQHFTSWLRLAPNNKISGGKIISSRTPKGKSHLNRALRNAANTVGNAKEGTLNSFFKRIAFKKGRGAAITATARKIAAIIYNMITKKEEYNPLPEKIYNEKIKARVLRNALKKLESVGFVNISISTS